MKRTTQGIIPPEMLLHAASATGHIGYLNTLITTQQLWAKGQNNSVTYKKALKNAQRIIYDAKNTQRLPGTQVRTETGKATSDNIVNNAFDFHGMMRDFLKAIFGRDSIDGAGMDLIGTVHYGTGYNNAFWNSRQMTYGDGDGVIFATFVLLDVIGHEMFHGVTEHTCGLEYDGQSGALNESLSDVFGVGLRQWVKKLSVDKDSWLIGPGIFTAAIKGRALRDMLNPGTAYDDPKIGKDRQPAHMKDFVVTNSDNGGVHTNSGITNKAFAEFAIAVGGFSWEKALPVWFLTATTAGRIKSDCDFQTFANATLVTCREKFPEIVDKLVAAWAKVGIAAV
jgi:Zn-dependent metalloprotease